MCSTPAATTLKRRERFNRKADRQFVLTLATRISLGILAAAVALDCGPLAVSNSVPLHRRPSQPSPARPRSPRNCPNNRDHSTRRNAHWCRCGPFHYSDSGAESAAALPAPLGPGLKVSVRPACRPSLTSSDAPRAWKPDAQLHPPSEVNRIEEHNRYDYHPRGPIIFMAAYFLRARAEGRQLSDDRRHFSRCGDLALQRARRLAGGLHQLLKKLWEFS